MFSGQTAWFSASVPSKRTRLWKQHEGKVVSFDKAQFVFSDDCQCPDTKRLYESDAYISEHLAIFHSSYVSECVKKEDITKVVLGDFFLPPLEVMEVIRGQAKLAWEKMTDQSEEETDDHVSEGSENSSRPDRCGRSTKNLQETNGSVDNRKSSRTTSDKMSPVRIGSEESDITHVDSLPKVTGILEEFHPGKNGCVVFRKS